MPSLKLTARTCRISISMTTSRGSTWAPRSTRYHGICRFRKPPAALHSDRRRLQHELGHSRLSRRQRQLEANTACALSGLPRGRCPIRRRYWARSMIGWRRFGQAQPNDAHLALARLEASGRSRSRMLLTQNVDGLHQAGREQGGHRPPRTPRSGPLLGLHGRPTPRRYPS